MLIRRPAAPAVSENTTFVRVQESGWTGEADKLMRYVLMRYVADSSQGFTLMLAGMKASLEHNIRLNLTTDRHPEGIEDQTFE